MSLSPYPVAYDDRNAREELGWSPDYSIEAAAAEHLAMVSNRGRSQPPSTMTNKRISQ